MDTTKEEQAIRETAVDSCKIDSGSPPKYSQAHMELIQEMTDLRKKNSELRKKNSELQELKTHYEELLEEKRKTQLNPGGGMRRKTKEQAVRETAVSNCKTQLNQSIAKKEQLEREWNETIAEINKKHTKLIEAQEGRIAICKEQLNQSEIRLENSKLLP
jgi:uncharacterized protein YhaN